eukprot:scaffold119195_cov50-Attheya_sp.AAC.1
MRVECFQSSFFAPLLLALALALALAFRPRFRFFLTTGVDVEVEVEVDVDAVEVDGVVLLDENELGSVVTYSNASPKELNGLKLEPKKLGNCKMPTMCIKALTMTLANT